VEAFFALIYGEIKKVKQPSIMLGIREAGLQEGLLKLFFRRDLAGFQISNHISKIIPHSAADLDVG